MKQKKQYYHSSLKYQKNDFCWNFIGEKSSKINLQNEFMNYDQSQLVKNRKSFLQHTSALESLVNGIFILPSHVAERVDESIIISF